MNPRALLLIGPLLFTACSAGSLASSTGDSQASTTSSNAASSAKLDTELFGSGDPADGTEFVLVGNLPGSAEPCTVRLRRNGLTPAKNRWSTIAIHALGPSAKTLEENGPTQVGYAFPAGGSSDVQSVAVDGDKLVYRLKGGAQSPTDVALTLTFSGSHHWTGVTRAEIVGDDVVGHEEEACESLHVGITFDSAEIAKVEQAKSDWGSRNNEDVSDLDYEGCEVKSVKSVSCLFGNDTNEETLTLVFALTDGHIGKVTHADRESER